MADERELFIRAMKGVKRLKAEQRRLRKESPSPRATGPVAAPATGTACSSHAPPDERREPWVLAADGISRQRLRLLAAGQPPVDTEIDLHGMTRSQAIATLTRHIEQAPNKGWRVLALIHGRGLHSRGGRPLLKEAVYRYLASGPLAGEVLAVIPRPGSGGGSCLVLLRRRRNRPAAKRDAATKG